MDEGSWDREIVRTEGICTVAVVIAIVAVHMMDRQIVGSEIEFLI